jgi:hypothetical protein
VSNDRRKFFVHARHDPTFAKPHGNLTSMSFLFLFSLVDFWKLEKLEHIEGSGRNPGNIEPYMVPSQQSTYENAVTDQNGSYV